MPVFLDINPSGRESHTRRREPGHIPRPRNAFIIFRSFYVRRSAGEGQQNELSKQAAKVWNRMTEKERVPFVERATAEKTQHQAMYPNYTYCPGRGAARRKGRTVTKNTSGPKRKASAVSSSTSSSFDPTFPEISFDGPTQRPLRAAAQRAIGKFSRLHSISSSPCPMSPTPEESPMLEHLELDYPEPEPATPAEEFVYVPTGDSRACKTDILAEEDAFVRTVNSPFRALTSSKREEFEPQFDLTMRPAHLDRMPEQFGFKYHSDPSAMFAFLPPMPNANDDTECTGDVTSLFAQLSRHPANLPLSKMVDNPVTLLPDGCIAGVRSQCIPHYSDSESRILVPGFTWSSCQKNIHYTSMVSEDMWSEEEVNDFMYSCFDFEVERA